MTTTTTEIKEILALFADDINDINEKIEKLDIKINGRLHDKSIFDLMNDLSNQLMELDYLTADTNKRINDLEQEIKRCKNDK